MLNGLHYELHNILSGKSEVRFGAAIQAVAHHLGNGKKTGAGIENEKHFKREEAEKLKKYIDENNLWINNIDFSQYVSEGAEQKVYLKDSETVIKLNDSIYYSCWTEYFHNLLLHNFFFPDTAYELIGFTVDNETLFAVVSQNYVKSDAPTDLSKVKTFLQSNGFENNRNNDYINHDLGVILEDLHDENVLTQNNLLYFIDTVFYLTDKFWSKE
ncbi:putative polyvalent protein kinase domain-containing protein [Chryseobacterium caseinilyticum]|uniref:Uncharacterized protein n=1 Tax=Chryseobacterium caseinilyticum TaxID=2771428 RepID=A0ABR8ZAA7_9FLAO|nr:hypothetical protein [Chryseobacterium caseinilyticum]MBD8082161.1 hypothetical protein [Chryseobacterium caseinilyticum]